MDAKLNQNSGVNAIFCDTLTCSSALEVKESYTSNTSTQDVKKKTSIKS